MFLFHLGEGHGSQGCGEEPEKTLPCILPFPVRAPTFNTKCVKKFWLPRATVAHFLQHSEATGRAERGRGLRQGKFVGTAVAQMQRG